MALSLDLDGFSDVPEVQLGHRMSIDPSTHTSAEPAIPDTGATRPSVIVRPVVNAIRILRLLAAADRPQTAAQIATSIGINRSTCFNILKTLTDEQAIEFDLDTKTYALPAAAESWHPNRIGEQRLNAARALMRELSAHYSVTTSLWRRWPEDRITLIAVEHSPSALRIHLTEGQRLPILMGSTGRAMAPHLNLSKKVLQERFRQLRWEKPISFTQFQDEISLAEARGYAIDEGYFARGVTSIGVAVLDRQGAPRYSVTAIMFADQHDPSMMTTIGCAIKALAPELAKVLL